MPLKTFVKAGNITNLSDARYCAGMGVDMLGFKTIEGQENYIKPTQFQEIRGWITGPLVIAEIYGLKNANELAAILEHYKPDYLEMGPDELSLFSALPLPFILATPDKTMVGSSPLQPEYIISKTPFETEIPLLIEIQSKAEIESLLSNPQVKGFVLSGTSELRPGLKDFEMMADVLELLEIED
jgi:phosphoribosylanthranilate isomerase